MGDAIVSFASLILSKLSLFLSALLIKQILVFLGEERSLHLLLDTLNTYFLQS